jgi:transcriptional antiterminator RfaH
VNWYAVYTKSNAEDSVCGLLGNAGIETINPKIKVKKYVRKKYAEVVEHLFPCYILACFDVEKYLHMVRYTRGIKYIVGKANPVVVHSEIIDAIKARMEGDIVTMKPEKFNKGDKVLIKEGPFRDFYGIFERDIPGQARSMLLLDVLHCKIDIESSSLKKA